MINQNFDYLYAEKGQVMGVKAYRYADITLASVAMSDTGPFRASLPGQYQRNKITHVLLKIDDNKPVYVKVIENVKDNQSCAVVVTPKDYKEWVMFQLALWSVGGDVTKNSELRKRVVQHIQDYFLEDSEATNQ